MSTLAAHALFSASGAEGWMNCAPKLAAEFGKKDSTSKFAAEGTAAHELASWVLGTTAAHGAPVNDGGMARAFLGTVIKADGFEFTVDEDMAGHVQTYADAIRQRIEEFKLRGAISVELLVEVRVDYSRFLGVPDSFGTSDVVLLVEWPNDEWQIDVGDLKYGMGVQVYASSEENGVVEGNKQMMLYALGALDQFAAVMGTVTKASMAIYQPRLRHIDEFECSVEDLLVFADKAKAAAGRALRYFDAARAAPNGVLYIGAERAPANAFSPGEKQCRWCKVGGTCEARTAKNLSTMAGDFVDLDEHNNVGDAAYQIADVVTDAKPLLALSAVDRLDALYPSLDEIDNWVKAVRGEIEKRALAGETFSTCKLVQGKRGSRAWTDEEEAEKLMKGMRLKQDQMYTFKLISPTVAEKLLAETPKRWNKLKNFIGQSEGELSVAAISDKRQAIKVTPAADDFDELPADADDLC